MGKGGSAQRNNGTLVLEILQHPSHGCSTVHRYITVLFGEVSTCFMANLLRVRRTAPVPQLESISHMHAESLGSAHHQLTNISPPPPQTHLPSHEQQANRTGKRCPEDHVASHSQGLLREPGRRIEHQVPDAVDEVKGERPGNGKLKARLDGDGQAGKGSDEALALEVPAQQRRGQVCRRVNVYGAAEGAARDPLPDGRAEVGLLLVVDLQMGADGPLEALLLEDRVAFGGVELMGGEGSARGGFVSAILASVRGFAASCEASYRICVAARFDVSAALARFWVKNALDGLLATGDRANWVSWKGLLDGVF